MRTIGLILGLGLVACGGDGGTGGAKSGATTTTGPTTTAPITTAPNASVVTTTLSPTVSISADCSAAKIVRPKPDEPVRTGRVTLEWTPATCLMDVAYYQSETLKGKWTGVRSGEGFDLAAPPPGLAKIRTELKIWRPGDPEPAHSIWVVVER